MTVREFLTENAVTVIAITVAVLGLIILLLVYNLRSKSKSNQQIQNLLYRDTLTGLDNLDKFLADVWQSAEISARGWLMPLSTVTSTSSKPSTTAMALPRATSCCGPHAQIIQERCVQEGEYWRPRLLRQFCPAVKIQGLGDAVHPDYRHSKGSTDSWSTTHGCSGGRSAHRPLASTL